MRHIVLLEAILEQVIQTIRWQPNLTVNSDGAVTLNAGDYSINGCGETVPSVPAHGHYQESFTAADTIPSSNAISLLVLYLTLVV